MDAMAAVVGAFSLLLLLLSDDGDGDMVVMDA
jgi:hypothetical protein